MYFSLIPDIQYDTKPISYPFSESDYVTAKNFFRRYQINKDLFDYATFYKKYSVREGERIEGIAKQYYGDPFYDWVIALTNNFINPTFAFPLDNNTLRIYVEGKYGEVEAYSEIHHYETIELSAGYSLSGNSVLALEGGLIVDRDFYSSTFTYWNGFQYISVPGSTVSKSITNYEYEVEENEKRREIFILRPEYLGRFLDEFKIRNLYNKSSDFVSKRLKKTAV